MPLCALCRGEAEGMTQPSNPKLEHGERCSRCEMSAKEEQRRLWYE